METDFLSNASFRREETDFLLSLLLLIPSVVLVKTIIQIKVKPFFIEYSYDKNLLLLETIFYEFF